MDTSAVQPTWSRTSIVHCKSSAIFGYFSENDRKCSSDYREPLKGTSGKGWSLRKPATLVWSALIFCANKFQDVLWKVLKISVRSKNFRSSMISNVPTTWEGNRIDAWHRICKKPQSSSIHWIFYELQDIGSWNIPWNIKYVSHVFITSSIPHWDIKARTCMTCS